MRSAGCAEMQVPSMALHAGQLVRMHSMLGDLAAANGKTGVLKHTSKAVWVVTLEEPCVIGSHEKNELRIHPMYLTGLSQAPLSFLEKLQAALIAERQKMQANGVLQMERLIVPNPLAGAVHAGHTNVYDDTVQLAFNTYLSECEVVVPTTAGSPTMADRDQQVQEIADEVEQNIWTTFNARVKKLGLWDKHHNDPDHVAITALTAEYHSTCLAEHAAYHAKQKQRNDDALHKFISQVRPCHKEGCVARGQKNAFNAATGEFRSALCSGCKVGALCAAALCNAAVATVSVSRAVAADFGVAYSFCRANLLTSSLD